MNLDDYFREVNELRVYAGRDTELGLAIAALGLGGETFEYLEDLTPDELGDVLWYTVAVLQELGWTLPMAGYGSGNVPKLGTVTGVVVDTVKKLLSKGEYGNLPGSREFLLQTALADLVIAIEIEATRHGYTLAELADLNLAKLHGRRDTTGVLR